MRSRRPLGAIAAGLVLAIGSGTSVAAEARAGESAKTKLVSVSKGGGGANDDSYDGSISASGRFVAFWSDARNLVRGDGNGDADIFVRDMRTGRTRLASVPVFGPNANGHSYLPSISASGRFVAFHSYAQNLVRRDRGGADVFVRDLETGKTRRVSIGLNGVRPNAGSFEASISDNGRRVAWESSASNLVEGDTEENEEVFVRDLETGRTTRVTVGLNGAEPNSFNAGSGASISANGRFVAFSSRASNLVRDDANSRRDVFVRDLKIGRTHLVSVRSDGTQPRGDSYNPSISANGRFVVFRSNATNLVAGDTRRNDEVFVHDRKTGDTRRVSVSFRGGESNGTSHVGSISASGRFIAFYSDATNVVAGDSRRLYDAFVRDLKTRTTRRVSIAPNGAWPKRDSYSPAISADGRFIAFTSPASTLVRGDENRDTDVFRRGPLRWDRR
jgi:Tol biopolymer transport system component